MFTTGSLRSVVFCSHCLLLVMLALMLVRILQVLFLCFHMKIQIEMPLLQITSFWHSISHCKTSEGSIWRKWLLLEFKEGISNSCETKSQCPCSLLKRRNFIQSVGAFFGARQLRFLHFIRHIKKIISLEQPLYSTCQLKLYLCTCTSVTPCPDVHMKKTKLVKGKVEM